MRRYNWWFLLIGAFLAAAIFAASLALFPEGRGETRGVIVLAAAAVVSAFGFLASFRQAVEQPPDPPSEGQPPKTNRPETGKINNPNRMVGDGNPKIQTGKNTPATDPDTLRRKNPNQESGTARIPRLTDIHPELVKIIDEQPISDAASLAPEKLPTAPMQTPSKPAQPTGRPLPFEPETVLIPAGNFWMGSTDKDADENEKPCHRVYLDAYRIGRYPVTVAQFRVFIDQTGYRTPAEENDTWHHPVTQVSWEDAAAYCAWLSTVTGREYGLPSEAQWEKAARGADGRRYPWGNAPPDRTRCNISNWAKGTTPVGLFSPLGDSPYGIADMAGNVWEWCADWYYDDYYKVSPRRNPPGPPIGDAHPLRGGSWGDFERGARCSSRGGDGPDDFGGGSGFRVVVRPPSSR